MDISNNTAERGFLLFVVGPKNWLLNYTPEGADSNAIIYTLVESAKVTGQRPICIFCASWEDLHYF